MFSINPSPMSSLTTEELVRIVRNMMYNGAIPPLPWIEEIVRRVERTIDTAPDITDVDPKQTSFDFDSK